MMKLYFTPGACSLAPHIALRELDLPFDLIEVDLGEKRTVHGDNFLEINPKGQVPALVLDDGTLLTEVPAVVQYIADQKPDAGLVPAPGSFDRYRTQEWLNFVTSEVHKSLGQLFRPDLPDEVVHYIREAVTAKFSYLNRHLADNDYLLESGFSVADLYAFNVINWTKFLAIELAPWPNLVSYMDRIAERPAVRDAMQAEGLADA